MKKTSLWLAIAIITLLPSVSLSQTTVDLSAEKDNTMYSEGTLSNGNGIYIFSGNTNGSDTRRALLSFDIDGTVPAGATITAVTLTLNMSRTNGGAETVSLHRLTSDWGEAGSNATGNEGTGAAAQAGDATWASAFHGSTAWGSAGGDFNGSASASQSIDQNGFYTWASTATLVSDVQSMLNTPAGDFGWAVVGDEGNAGTAKRFDSRTNSTSGNRPVLSVTYTEGLPVTLTNFSVIQNAKTALLLWETASEINNSGFEIEMATADKNWVSAGWVDGNGSTTQAQNWQFAINLASSGLHQFRLKQVDFNGAIHYSETISLNAIFEDALVLTTLYPNPANTALNLSFDGVLSQPGKATVFNLLGQVVFTKDLFGADFGDANSLLIDTKAWPAGVYFIQLTSNQSTKTQQFIVTH